MGGGGVPLTTGVSPGPPPLCPSDKSQPGPTARNACLELPRAVKVMGTEESVSSPQEGGLWGESRAGPWDPGVGAEGRLGKWGEICIGLKASSSLHVRCGLVGFSV